MPIRSAAVTTNNPTLTAQVIEAWRRQFCRGAFDPILTHDFQPLTARQRLSVIIDGEVIPFEPSWLALDGIVLIFHRVSCRELLEVAFYDQAANQFLPAITKLTMAERIKLGAGRRRDRQEYLRSLIENARNFRVPVGA